MSLSQAYSNAFSINGRSLQCWCCVAVSRLSTTGKVFALSVALVTQQGVGMTNYSVIMWIWASSHEQLNDSDC